MKSGLCALLLGGMMRALTGALSTIQVDASAHDCLTDCFFRINSCSRLSFQYCNSFFCSGRIENGRGLRRL
jgi:hypothetical protein